MHRREKGELIKRAEQCLSNAARLMSKGEYEKVLTELNDAYKAMGELFRMRRLRGSVRRLWLGVLIGLVHALIALQRYDEALVYANIACASFKRNPFCNLLRAQVLASLKRCKEAIKDVKRAMKGCGEDANAMLKLAKIAFDAGEYGLAADCCRCALERNSDLLEAYLLLSESLRRVGSTEEALNVVIGALTKGLASVQLKIRAAELYHELGELKKAISMLESAAAESDDEGIEIALAELHMELGDYAKMIEHCSKALRHAPDEPLLLDMLAFAHLQLGNLDEAIQILVRLVRIAPTDTFTRFRLATLYHQKGAYANAMREYQRILAMEPNGIFSEPVKAAIQQLDEAQLEQVFILTAEDPVFRAKLHRDPVKALQERGFYLTEAAIEMLKNANLTPPRKSGSTPVA